MAQDRAQDHLYVMQASDGFLKVGRSRKPTRRREQLEHEFCVGIEIVAVLRWEGHKEQAVLAGMSAYEAHGAEWFHDVPAARERLAQLIGAPLKFRSVIRRTYKAAATHPAWADAQVAWWISMERWKAKRKADREFDEPRPIRPTKLPPQRPVIRALTA